MKLKPEDMYQGEVCLSWRQRVDASDQHIRLHRVAFTVGKCELEKMEDYQSFKNEAVAQQAISAPSSLHPGPPESFKRYKRCAHCWKKGGGVIEI